MIATGIQRGGALSIWRQIAQALEADIAAGSIEAGGQLQSEYTLADRFGVNRHTVRQAIAHLADRGLVRVDRGRGIFVRSRSLDYPIGERTRFHEIVRRGNRAPSRSVIACEDVKPDRQIAADLRLSETEHAWRVVTVSAADGSPIGTSDHFFPRHRFPDLPAAMPTDNSITTLLRNFGITDYVRRWTRISARPATAEEARRLDLKRARPVLVTEALNVDANGVPVEYGLTRMVADRVTLTIEHQS